MATLIFKNLARRKTRTLLTLLGIAVGVALIVALGAMGEGLHTGYVSMFSGSGASLVMMRKGSYDITLSGVDEDIVTQVAAMPEVSAAGGIVVGGITAPGSTYFYVFGYDPKGFAIQRFKLVEGQMLGASHQATNSREILLGKQAAKALKLGDMLRLPGGSFRIVGIYATGNGFEDVASVVSLADGQQLLQKPRQVGAVQIKLRDLRQIDQVREKLERLYPKLTISESSRAAEAQQAMSTIQDFAWGIALLAIIVGGVGMTNTVTMSAFERTREIGTLRALGWRRRRVLTMVLEESLVISLIGVVAGVALAFVLSQLMKLIPMFGDMLPVVFSPDVLMRALIVALGLGAVGGLYPAWRAANLQSVEALRYE